MLLVIVPPRCAGLLLKRLLLFIHSWNLYWELLDKVRLPCWLRGKESICQSRRCKFNPWVGKIALRRKWQPTPAFLPGKSRGQGNLVGYGPCWSANTLVTWYKELHIGKDPDAWKDWGQEEKGATEDEMVGWHHRLSGLEFEQAPGDSEGQGIVACCSPCGHKELDRTEWLNNKWFDDNILHRSSLYHLGCMASG